MFRGVFKIAGSTLFSVQFLKFLLIGGTAALANLLSRFAFELFFSYIVSVALAFSVGTVVSFVFNKSFTFRAYDEKTVFQIIKFAVVYLGLIFLASSVVYVIMEIHKLLNFYFIPEESMKTIAHIIAIAVTTIYNFFAMKYFSFRKFSFNSKRGELSK